MKQSPVSAILVLPFSFEGRNRRTAALQGSASMHNQVDRVIHVDNNRCLSTQPRHQSLLDSFNAINQHIAYECSLILEQIDQLSSELQE
jgi:cell division GTPase FtsZ